MAHRLLGILPVLCPRPLFVACALSTLAAAYHYDAVSTAGTTHRSQEHDDPWTLAARESGARELKCDREPCEVAPVSAGKYRPSVYVADGCGKRAVYKCAPASLSQPCEMVLVAKFDGQPTRARRFVPRSRKRDRRSHAGRR